MPIGTSDGETFNSEFEYVQSKFSQDSQKAPKTLEGFKEFVNRLDPDNKTGIGNFTKGALKFLDAYHNNGTVTSEDLVPLADPGLFKGAGNPLPSKDWREYKDTLDPNKT